MSATKKHILILPRWYPNHADIQLGIFIKKQALLLKDLFQISVIYVQGKEHQSEKYKIEHSTLEGINEQIVYFKKDTSILKKIINFRRYKNAQKLAYQNLTTPVDLCHVHVPIRPAFLALTLLKSKQIPFVITEHWSGHLTGEFLAKPLVYKLYYKSILKKATKVSCVSRFLQHQFELNTGLKPIVIPNYIEYLKPTSATQTKQINILSVNDFIDSIKNITGILSAFKLAIAENPNLHLTLIGDGPDREKINAHLKHLQIPSENLTLLGRLNHNEVLKHMQNCNFYVSFSNFETFGMTIAEALLCGKPVVSTQSGGPNEFLNDGNSITVHKKDEDSLKNAILNLAHNYPTFNPKNIAFEIEQKYGKLAITEKFVDFYNI